MMSPSATQGAVQVGCGGETGRLPNNVHDALIICDTRMAPMILSFYRARSMAVGSFC